MSDSAAPDAPVAASAEDLALARSVADAADLITLPAFAARGVAVEWKADRSEVTAIDREVETMIVRRLVDARPGHAVFGEEHGLAGDAGSPWRWMVDPIDGTSGFARGIPVWATLIALTHADAGAVMGVVSAPALGHRWWGGAELGAFASAYGTTRGIAVSSVDELAAAQVNVTVNSGWARLGLVDRLVDLQLAARRSRGGGDFWQHMLVAEGAIDVAIDAVGVAPYDLAALQPIVEAAGGRFTDRHGEPTHEHDTAISTNGLLHDDVLRRLTP